MNASSVQNSPCSLAERELDKFGCFLLDWARYMSLNPDQRAGQAAVNAIHEYSYHTTPDSMAFPSQAEEHAISPFYNDSLIPAFLMYLRRIWPQASI